LAAMASQMNESKVSSLDACGIILSGYDSDDGQPILGSLVPRLPSAPLATHLGGRAGASREGAKENQPEHMPGNFWSWNGTAASSLDSSNVRYRSAQRFTAKA
jgi:hypothetical protein